MSHWTNVVWIIKILLCMLTFQVCRVVCSFSSLQKRCEFVEYTVYTFIISSYKNFGRKLFASVRKRAAVLACMGRRPVRACAAAAT